MDLITRYFKQEYKRFIQEALDTEGKSKQLFLDVLDTCIEETKAFFADIKERIFKANQLELDAEMDSIFRFLFADYQKLYHQKEMANLDKVSQGLFTKLIEKVK